MIYEMRRRFRGRRRRFRGRRSSGFLGKAGKALAVATTALSVARGVKSLLNVEYKHFDTAISATADDEVYDLNLIVQGDDENMRNGNSVKAKTLSVRGELRGNVDGNLGVQSIRLILCIDKDANGSANDALGPADSVNGIVDSSTILSFRNLDHSKRYRVLWDRVWHFSDDRVRIQVNKTWKLNHEINWIAGSDAIAALGPGALRLFVIGEADALNDPSIGLIFRLRYLDN